jgi:hypothetical protein
MLVTTLSFAQLRDLHNGTTIRGYGDRNLLQQKIRQCNISRGVKPQHKALQWRRNETALRVGGGIVGIIVVLQQQCVRVHICWNALRGLPSVNKLISKALQAVAGCLWWCKFDIFASPKQTLFHSQYAQQNFVHPQACSFMGAPLE